MHWSRGRATSRGHGGTSRNIILRGGGAGRGRKAPNWLETQWFLTCVAQRGRDLRFSCHVYVSLLSTECCLDWAEVWGNAEMNVKERQVWWGRNRYRWFIFCLNFFSFPFRRFFTVLNCFCRINLDSWCFSQNLIIDKTSMVINTASLKTCWEFL